MNGKGCGRGMRLKVVGKETKAEGVSGEVAAR
jgi:hypothetical protein